jgi:hypothetical protein
MLRMAVELNCIPAQHRLQRVTAKLKPSVCARPCATVLRMQLTVRSDDNAAAAGQLFEAALERSFAL